MEFVLNPHPSPFCVVLGSIQGGVFMVFDLFSSVVMGLLKMTIVKFEKLAFTMGVFNRGAFKANSTVSIPLPIVNIYCCGKKITLSLLNPLRLQKTTVPKFIINGVSIVLFQVNIVPQEILPRLISVFKLYKKYWMSSSETL